RPGALPPGGVRAGEVRRGQPGGQRRRRLLLPAGAGSRRAVRHRPHAGDAGALRQPRRLCGEVPLVWSPRRRLLREASRAGGFDGLPPGGPLPDPAPGPGDPRRPAAGGGLALAGRRRAAVVDGLGDDRRGPPRADRPGRPRPHMTSPRLLVLGDTGLAGTAVVQAPRARGLEVAGASRRGEIRLAPRDAEGISAVVAEVRPSHIVNAAALVSVPDCEADPGLAWSINARPAALLAQAARGIGARVTHISTDHYFTGDGARAHDEDAPVTLVNEYARSKYAAEALALTHADTVVVRTNLIGLASATG